VSGGGLQLTLHCPNSIADAVLLAAERRKVDGTAVVSVEQPAALCLCTCQLASQELAL
jgi:hypothetical protein